MFRGFNENIKKLIHKLSTPLATALISAFVGAFIGSYLSYRVQTSAEMESKAIKVINHLTLIREELKRNRMIIERGQLIDKVLLSKFLGWEDIKKETQEKTRKEYFGRTIGSPLSSRMIGLAMDDLDFLNVDTRFIITLDELYATVRKINDSIKYMHELTYGICALDNPKQYIDVLRNAEMDLNKDTERITKLISDCLNDIEGEINRFSRRAPVR